MKKSFSLILVCLFVLLAACQAVEAPVAVATEALGPVSTAIETSPTEAYPIQPAATAEAAIEIRYAQNFTFEYRDGYKLLTVTQPWMGAEEEYAYALVPRGAQMPSDVGDAMLIEVPVQSFVAMSATYYLFLERIDAFDSLIAIDDATYTFNPIVQEMAANGELLTVGSGAGMNIEKLIELDPDLIMTSASGFADYDSHPKLLEAGLPVVINADYLEATPLGRAEWGIFIAALFDKEALASQEFNDLEDRYEEARDLTQGISDKVSVFVNTDIRGSWYMPGGESYAAQFLADAGADYLWSELPGTGASPLAFELVFEEAKDADFWLNLGFAFNDLAGVAAIDERYMDFDAFQNGNVYNYNKRTTETGGADYFESGVANPDLVLKDLIKIFYPELLPDYSLYYYQKLQ